MEEKFNSDSPELRCRVCYMAFGSDELMCAPCKCSGSIQFVHQECLERWLEHSKKSTCELCSSKYQFEPEYAKDTPEVLPSHLLLLSSLKLIFVNAIPSALRIALTIFLWCFVVPLATSWQYRCWIRTSLLLLPQHLTERSTWENITADIASGFVLTGTIIVSFIILMSFADFLRFHWGMDQEGAFGRDRPNRFNRNPLLDNNPNRNRLQRNNQHRAVVQQNVAPDPPPVVQRLGVREAEPALAREEAVRRRLAILQARAPRIQRIRAHENYVDDLLNQGIDVDGEEATLPLASHHDDETLLEDTELDRAQLDNATLNHGTVQEQLDELSKIDDALKLRASKTIWTEADLFDPQDGGDSSARRPSSSSIRNLSSLSEGKPSSNDSGSSASSSSSDESSGSPEIDAKHDNGVGNVDSRPVPRVRVEVAFNNLPIPAPLDLIDVMPDEHEADDLAQNIENEALAHAEFRQRDENVPENNDEDSDDDDDDDFDDEGPGIGDGDPVIHLALDDLLGVRGPLHVLFRNVIWLLIFNTFYMGMFVALPYVVGCAVASFAAALPVFSFWYSALPAATQHICQRITEISISSTSTLRLLDVPIVGLGYCTLVALVFAFESVFSWIYYRTGGYSQLAIITEIFGAISSIVKAGVLLFIRIFILPLVLGIAALYGLNFLFQKSADDWLALSQENMVGMLALSWAVGISYMLTVTLSVLQLREVLHPDILAKFIRPQEAHQDLLNSLMNESAPTHVWRICISMLVYAALLSLLVFLPVYFLRVVTMGERWNVHTFYLASEVQIPLEIAISHVIFLSVLERNKNIIGRLQHQWLCWTGKILGVTRFILPCPMKAAEGPNPSDLDNPNDNDDIVIGGRRFVRDAIEPDLPAVGLPLRRPPRGWDARGGRVSNLRWAWNNEPPSDIELNLAPRAIPKYWLVPTCILLVASWFLIVAIVALMILVPLQTGRCIARILQVPNWLLHDPLCFLVGFVFSASIVFTMGQANWTRVWTRAQSAFNYVPRATAWHVFVLAIEWQMVETMAGLTLKIFAASSFESMTSFGYLLECSVLGGVVVALCIAAVLQGGLKALCRLLGMPDPLEEWTLDISRALTEGANAFTLGRFSANDLQVQVFEGKLVRPAFRTMLSCVIPSAVSAMAASTCYDHMLQTAPAVLHLLGSLSARITQLLEAGTLVAVKSLGMYAVEVFNALWLAVIDQKPSDLLILVQEAAAFIKSGQPISPTALSLLACKCMTAGILFYWLVTIVQVPVHAWIQLAVKTIRDEHYLIGRKLRNHISHSDDAARQYTHTM